MSSLEIVDLGGVFSHENTPEGLTGRDPHKFIFSV